MSHGKWICIACCTNPKVKKEALGCSMLGVTSQLFIIDIKVDTHKGNYDEGLAS